jgi:hypothetical protein
VSPPRQESLLWDKPNPQQLSRDSTSALSRVAQPDAARNCERRTHSEEERERSEKIQAIHMDR